MRGVTVGTMALATLLSLAAPAAVGQLAQVETNVDVDLPNQPAPIPPGAVTFFEATVRYSSSGQVPLTSMEPTRIRLEVIETPPWANVSFNRTELVVDNVERSTSGGVYSEFVNLTVGIAPNAPAFSIGTVRVQVTAEENPPLQGSTEEDEFEVQAGFRGTVQARLMQAPLNGTISVRGGFQQYVDVELTNTGNGPLRVALEATRPPAESQWEIVESSLDVGGTEVVRVPVRTPWRVTFEFPTEITVTPTHAQRGVQGEPQDLTFTLRGESLVPIPSAGPIAVPLALAGLALLLRRRPRP